MISAIDGKTRICSSCFRDLPLREFRFRNRARGTRHSACRECRVQRDRRARTKHRKRLTKRELTALRRACSAELLGNLVDSLIGRLGGVENLVSMWLGLITKGQPTATRIKALETLLHTMGVADSVEFGEEVFELANSPQEMALHWHKQGKLAPLIREMLADGRLSWDDIDPPPTG